MRTTIPVFAIALALVGCVAQPMGPTIAVMPAPNKPFEVFVQDQAACREFADGQIAGGAQVANNQALGTAAIGTALGAGLSAAVGEGRGAAVGAGTGAIAGTAIGSGQSERAQLSLQQRYDNAYAECMYAKGNAVPGMAALPAPPPPPPPPYH